MDHHYLLVLLKVPTIYKFKYLDYLLAPSGRQSGMVMEHQVLRKNIILEEYQVLQ